MAESADKAEKKIAKNFRLPSATTAVLEELSSFFNQSQADVIVRSVNFFNNNRKLAIEQESAQIISKLASK